MSTLTDIAERLARMEQKQDTQGEKLERLDEKLFGNGQPGVLAGYDTRITALERIRWKIAGMTSLIIILLTITGLVINWYK